MMLVLMRFQVEKVGGWEGIVEEVFYFCRGVQLQIRGVEEDDVWELLFVWFLEGVGCREVLWCGNVIDGTL